MVMDVCIFKDPDLDRLIDDKASYIDRYDVTAEIGNDYLLECRPKIAIIEQVCSQMNRKKLFCIRTLITLISYT